MAKQTTKVTFVRLPLDYYREATVLAEQDKRPSVANMLTVLVQEAIDARRELREASVMFRARRTDR